MINIVFIGQLIGYAIILMNILSFQQSEYKKIMTFQILSSACALLHYGLIFAWTAFFLNAIGLIRSILFLRRVNYSGKPCNWMFWLFLFLGLVAGIIGYVNIYSIVAIFSSMLKVIFLWNKNPKIVRILYIPASACWIVYCISCGSIPGIISELIVLSSVFIAMYRNRKKGQANA